MGRFSILPAQLSTLETWVVRCMLLFAALTLGPWLLFILYDVLLYLWRYLTYHLPYIGGRARGRQRPRAPSLTARPSGHRRHISWPNISPSPRRRGHEAASSSTGLEATSSSSVPRPHSKLRHEAH